MMKKRIGLALGAFVIWTAITILLGRFLAGGETSLLDGVTSGLGWAWIAAAAFILGVTLWQGWSDVRLTRGSDARGWRLAWLPMIYIVGGFGFATLLGLPPASALVLILINTFFVGFSEELMFRGVILQSFRHAVPIWAAVLITSVLFGSIHSLNVFVTGDLGAALIQSTAAFLSGIVFIALRLRTGSLWPPIVVHWLWDFVTFTVSAASVGASQGAAQNTLPAEAVSVSDGTGFAVFAPILLVLPNAIYGLWLLRNIGKTHRSPEM
jgi:membrane protease YdiL (CAAX protease family)